MPLGQRLLFKEQLIPGRCFVQGPSHFPSPSSHGAWQQGLHVTVVFEVAAQGRNKQQKQALTRNRPSLHAGSGGGRQAREPGTGTWGADLATTADGEAV